ERRHEQRIYHGHVHRVHGGDALRSWQTGEGLHHEVREGEEHARHQPASQRGDQRQHEQESFDHPGTPLLTARASSAIAWAAALAPGRRKALTARTNAIAAPRKATVRTWFQAVHGVR